MLTLTFFKLDGFVKTAVYDDFSFDAVSGVKTHKEKHNSSETTCIYKQLASKKKH